MYFYPLENKPVRHKHLKLLDVARIAQLHISKQWIKVLTSTLLFVTGVWCGWCSGATCGSNDCRMPHSNHTLRQPEETTQSCSGLYRFKHLLRLCKVSSRSDSGRVSSTERCLGTGKTLHFFFKLVAAWLYHRSNLPHKKFPPNFWPEQSFIFELKVFK